MTTLYIIHGFLGAGKTTYSKELAQKIKAQRLNADEWCKEIFPDQTYRGENWDACHAKSVETLWDKATQLLSAGQDVILDFGFWTKSSRDHARDRAKDLGVEFKHYYIFAPDAVLLQRLRERLGETPGKMSLKNIENFHELKRGFEEPQDSENAIIIKSYQDAMPLAQTLPPRPAS